MVKQGPGKARLLPSREDTLREGQGASPALVGARAPAALMSGLTTWQLWDAQQVICFRVKMGMTTAPISSDSWESMLVIGPLFAYSCVLPHTCASVFWSFSRKLLR